MTIWMQEQIQTINTQLVDIIGKKCKHSEVENIVLYNIASGGKRLRPLLTLSLARDLNVFNIRSSIITQTLSLEVLHIASLIHDDLPALDNDDFRRGKPTTHKIYGEGASLLIGDFLIGIAFRMASENTFEGENLTGILANAWTSLCEGQILDLQPGKYAKDEVDQKKTGALFVASAEYAGAFSKSSPETLEVLRDFGMIFGEAYQAQDDAEDEQESLRAHFRSKKEVLVEKLDLKLRNLEAISQRSFTFTRELIEHVFRT